MTTKKRRKLPGSGVDCVCGLHRGNCRFGYQHNWSSFVPEALWSNFGIDLDIARRGVMWCYECHSVHVPTINDEW